MPMLDAYIPEGALSPEAEDRLMARLTDILLENEGADPDNETARSIAWVFRHRVDVFVAGQAAIPRAESRTARTSVPSTSPGASRRSGSVRAAAAGRTAAAVIASSERGPSIPASARRWRGTVATAARATTRSGTWSGSSS